MNHRRRSRRGPTGNSRSESQAPLNPPPSSTPAWGEHIGSISMSQPQNMVNAPGGRGTVVNITVNRSDGETSSTTNDQHEDLHDSARADHEIYSNQLLTKKRGYPLWVPGPGMQHPIEYRRQGISIGDVGIITSTGEFDFLFNIFRPAAHPINRGVVPQGFSPLSLEDLVCDIQRTTVYGPNTYLASSSVRKIINWISETSIDQRFESTSKEAAILIMPDGATTQNLLNTGGVRSTISSNAKEWYTYARDTRGRYVKNGDIRVVVGFDKVASWGIAISSCNTGQTASYVFKHDPTHAYKWDCIGGSGRVGPQISEIYDLMEDNVFPQNQCVFVRTMNFTVSGRIWNDFPSEAIQQPDPGRRDSTLGNRGRTRGRRGSSGRGSGRGNAPSSHQPASIQGASNCIPSVNFDPVELGVDHPSTALHSYLHEKFPDANMVITEDKDWISVLNADDVVFPKPEDLCARILEAHELQTHQGIMHLLKKDNTLDAGGCDERTSTSSSAIIAPQRRRRYSSASHRSYGSRTPSPSSWGPPLTVMNEPDVSGTQPTPPIHFVSRSASLSLHGTMPAKRVVPPIVPCPQPSPVERGVHTTPPRMPVTVPSSARSSPSPPRRKPPPPAADQIQPPQPIIIDTGGHRSHSPPPIITVPTGYPLVDPPPILIPQGSSSCDSRSRSWSRNSERSIIITVPMYTTPSSPRIAPPVSIQQPRRGSSSSYSSRCSSLSASCGSSLYEHDRAYDCEPDDRERLYEQDTRYGRRGYSPTRDISFSRRLRLRRRPRSRDVSRSSSSYDSPTIPYDQPHRRSSPNIEVIDIPQPRRAERSLSPVGPMGPTRSLSPSEYETSSRDYRGRYPIFRPLNSPPHSPPSPHPSPPRKPINPLEGVAEGRGQRPAEETGAPAELAKDRRESECRRREDEGMQIFLNCEAQRNEEARYRADAIWRDLEERLTALLPVSIAPVAERKPEPEEDRVEMESIEPAPQQGAARTPGDVMEIIRLARDKFTKEHERLADQRAAFFDQLWEEKDNIIEEKNCRIRALEEELKLSSGVFKRKEHRPEQGAEERMMEMAKLLAYKSSFV